MGRLHFLIFVLAGIIVSSLPLTMYSPETAAPVEIASVDISRPGTAENGTVVYTTGNKADIAEERPILSDDEASVAQNIRSSASLADSPTTVSFPIPTMSRQSSPEQFFTVSQPGESGSGTVNPPVPATVRGNLDSYNIYQDGVIKPLPPSVPTGSEMISQTSFDTPKPQLPQLREPGELFAGPAESNTRDMLEGATRFYQQAIVRTRLSVVHIEAQIYKESVTGKLEEKQETGCGVIALLQNRFFVITNSHVAGNAVAPGKVKITLPNETVITPTAILTCPQIDIALLELNPRDLPTNITQTGAPVRVALFGNSDLVRVPDQIYCVGSPFGLTGSVTRGVVSGCERRNIPLNKSKDQIQNFFQIDAPVNPGNSGGPLINGWGEVVGIVTAIASYSGGNEGVAFALPINSVLKVANKLILDGGFFIPYLGIELDSDYDRIQRATYGIVKPLGAKVAAVFPNSPAAPAGFMPGDEIVRFNDEDVRDEVHFSYLVRLSRIGDRPRISINRNNKQYEVYPVLGKSPIP